MSCNGTGMTVKSEDIDKVGKTRCPLCRKLVKARLALGGHDGWVNNRPRYYYIPYHKAQTTGGFENDSL
jgi:hypothetical protein